MRADIVPGAVFPDYQLPDHRGKHQTLSALQQGDPLVLVLSRGSNVSLRVARDGQPLVLSVTPELKHQAA